MRPALAILAALILAGCQAAAVVNIGGTVNIVPVAKAAAGAMTSATEAREENPSTTTVKIPGAVP